MGFSLVSLRLCDLLSAPTAVLDGLTAPQRYAGMGMRVNGDKATTQALMMPQRIPTRDPMQLGSKTGLGAGPKLRWPRRGM